MDSEAKNLLTAAGKGDKDTVEALLAGGAEANARDEEGLTPLVLAALNGHTAIVEALLAHGADVNAQSALHAISGEKLVSPLEAAAQNKHSSTVLALLAGGASVAGTVGEKALLWAAKGGDAEVVAALLRHGANVNATDVDDETPLMWATFYGHLDVVKALLRAGADVNACRPGIRLRNTALDYAGRNTDVGKVLLAHGAN